MKNDSTNTAATSEPPAVQDAARTEPETKPATTPAKQLRWVVYPGPHPQALIAEILFDRDKPLQVDADVAKDLINRKKVNAAKAPKAES